jgi:phosphoribosylformylglycinamidine synthase
VRNRSEQYEARLVLVRVRVPESVLLAGMQGSVLPIAVAHGEGQAEFDSRAVQRRWPRHLGHAASRTGISHGAELLGAEGWGEDGGWMRLFRNARVFVG